MKRPNRNRAKDEEPTDGVALYEPEYCSIAEAVFRLEGGDADVAEAVGVHPSDVHEWRRKHREFAEACARGRSAVNTGTQRSAFRRAVGYDHEVETVLFSGDRSFVEISREHVPPDFGSCRWWLINRRPEKWKKLGDGGDERTLLEVFGDMFDAPAHQKTEAARAE